MALLFQNIKPIPQTHVFVIGIGGYPYLDKGIRATPQLSGAARQLGQLSSPGYSARAFCETVLDLENAGNWQQPLGSLEVLLSPHPEDTISLPGLTNEAATLQNIKDAYWRWKARCDTNADNIAVFYYCGHGLDNGEHFLLTEDFGRNPHNPWEGTIAFDSTRRAFFSCKAKTQLFFVDACRQLTPDMLSTQLPLNPIEQPNLFSKDCLYNLTQKAAAANESAYGRKNEISYYTSALIGALKGNAAEADEDGWCIQLSGIATKMNELIQAAAPESGFFQRCVNFTSDSTIIVRLSRPPQVKVKVMCNPTVALEKATLYCRDGDDNPVNTRAPESAPWEFSLDAGIYRLGASFPQGQYRDKSILTQMLPPFAKQTLNCML
ncbi:MAG: caspase family protein [Ferruginibacter sp.]